MVPPPCYRGEHSGCGLPAGCERKGASERSGGRGEGWAAGTADTGWGVLAALREGLPYWRVVVCANLPTFRLSSFSTCWEVGKLAGWVGGGTAGCERVSVMNRNDTAGGSPAVAAELAGSSSFTPG